MKDTKKKPDSGIQILAPINGKVIPLEQVPDPVFAEKIIGDGVEKFIVQWMVKLQQ